MNITVTKIKYNKLIKVNATIMKQDNKTTIIKINQYN